MGPILELKNVSKSFGNLHAIDDVSFGVAEKSVTILIGPNGSGKTTLINVAGGFYKPDSGRVIYQGKDITGLAPHKVYQAGVVRTFQIPQLFWKMTVLENVMAARKGHPGEMFSKAMVSSMWRDDEQETAEQAFRVLEIIGLVHMWDELANSLSGGQMKLLEIGRALMSGAKTILMDEPISGVNPTLAHSIFSTLLSLREDFGITFLFVEHRLDIALSYVDEVVAMAYGKLLAVGKPTEVMSDTRIIEAYLGG
ncbi:MAG TPA: ABC transporter ATP-binding protein [Nitrososphaerales archaeon]|nr:ABC transporter ATP-binding protein [Nitrososphaerales archaeon]